MICQVNKWNDSLIILFGNANHIFIIQYPVFKDKSMYDRRNDNARAHTARIIMS